MILMQLAANFLDLTFCIIVFKSSIFSTSSSISKPVNLRSIFFALTCCIFKPALVKIAAKSEEVIISACKQCGSNFMPTSAIHENITKAFNSIEEGIDIYVFDVEAREGFNLNKLKSGKNICLVTGPESGFSESELDFFKNRDIKLRLIGNNILRAETAPIVISSLVQNHFGKI